MSANKRTMFAPIGLPTRNRLRLARRTVAAFDSKETRMKSSLVFLIICIGAVGCGTARWGLVNVPPEQALSDSIAVQAITRALEPGEANCKVELVQAGAQDQISFSTVMQELTVTVCGKKQKFSIQRSQTRPDNVLVSAKRI
jgi:hypothetical protein